MTTVSTLGAILSDGRLHQGDPLFLTEKEINEIKDTSNVGRIEQDWCWDDRLWCRTRSDNMSFENGSVVWFRSSCLLLRNACSNGSKRIKQFFPLCVSCISRFEPSFAVALFPCNCARSSAEQQPF
jgi:hypothetical protein